MKKTKFQTAVCKMIANNAVRGRAREALLELAVNGQTRPVTQNSRSYSDCTEAVLEALQQIGMPECLPSHKGNYFRPGWYVINDAPRGGKLGQVIRINFD
jgi:hypothetical protein